MMRRKIPVLLCALLGLMAGSASAAVLFQDNFEAGLGAWTQCTQAVGSTSYTWGTAQTANDPQSGGTRGKNWFFQGGTSKAYEQFHPITIHPAATQIKLTVDLWGVSTAPRAFAGFASANTSNALVVGANNGFYRAGFNSGSARVTQAYTGAATTTQSGTALTFAAWHTLVLTIDNPLAKTQTYSASWDGTSQGTWSNTMSGTSPNLNCVFLGYNYGATSSSYWDNVLVEQFAPDAGKATMPAPLDGDITVPPSQAALTWDAPTTSSFFDVWFDAGTGTLSKVASMQTAKSWTLPTLAANATYKWRIDAYNPLQEGKATGDVWTFTTTPEPATMVMLALGGLLLRRRRA